VPSVHADGPDDDRADDLPDHSLRDRPILLADIDRILERSADVERLGRGAPIRAWRDDLTLILASLMYARTILAADAAILRRCKAASHPAGQSLIDDLPGVVNDGPAGNQEPRSGDELVGQDLDENLFGRTDQLLEAHQEMAQVDLSSPFDVAGSLAVIEEQLCALTERQEAVEARLQEIRAAVIREYQEGADPAHDQPA